MLKAIVFFFLFFVVYGGTNRYAAGDNLDIEKVEDSKEENSSQSELESEENKSESVEEKECSKPKGIPVNPGQAPFYAVIYAKADCHRLLCGGAIVHQNWILTSAHCLYGQENARAYGGVKNIKELDQAEFMSGDIHPEHFMIHPGYKHRSGRFNAALLFLCVPIRHSKYVGISNLPLWTDELSDGLSATVMGFGTVKDDDKEDDTLREVTKQIDNNGMCEEVYEEGVFHPEQHLCLRPGAEGSVCISDYGGAVSVIIDGRQSIQGIFNYVADDGCKKGFPDVYTRISAVLDWIYSVTGIQNTEKTMENKVNLEVENTEDSTNQIMMMSDFIRPNAHGRKRRKRKH